MKRTLKPIFPPAGIEREYEKRLKKPYVVSWDFVGCVQNTAQMKAR